MSQIHQEMEEISPLALEYIHSDNIYAHDHQFFVNFSSPETWNLAGLFDLTPTTFSFLLMRAILHKESQNTGMKLLHVPAHIKASISKKGFAEYFNQFFDADKVPALKGIQFSENPFSDLSGEKETFYIESSDSKSNFYCGGTLAKLPLPGTHKIVEKLFKRFELQGKTGHFYLRTRNNSYLYLLSPESKAGTFFIQQKNTIKTDFYYFHIKIDHVS